MRLAVITGTYPQPSETFIAREIAGLRARGHGVTVCSLFAPAVPEADVVYGWPTPAARLLRRVRGTAALGRRWGRLFDEQQIDVVLAHFGSLPSTVALAAAGTRPLVLSLHARDLYVEAERLPEKLACAAAAVTCTAANADWLHAHYPEAAAKIHLVYHGLPAVWLDVPPPTRPREPGAPLRLLAVGRLVEKKGFGVLLDALRLVQASVELRIVGDGPLRATLAEQAAGLPVRCDGWADQAAVRAAYAWADVFCCPSILAADGDRDGLPNVLVEAMATGLPAIGSRLSGLPEAIEDGANGLLTPPGDAGALAAAIDRLAADAPLRQQMGMHAAVRMRERFDGERWLGVLEGVLEGAVG